VKLDGAGLVIVGGELLPRGRADLLLRNLQRLDAGAEFKNAGVGIAAAGVLLNGFSLLRCGAVMISHGGWGFISVGGRPPREGGGTVQVNCQPNAAS